jgi:hypothetical protein
MIPLEMTKVHIMNVDVRGSGKIVDGEEAVVTTVALGDLSLTG